VRVAGSNPVVRSRKSPARRVARGQRWPLEASPGGSRDENRVRPARQACRTSTSNVHSLREQPRGQAVLVVNTDRNSSHEIRISSESEPYTLTAGRLADPAVERNHSPLALELPRFLGALVPPGTTVVPPAIITFFAVRGH
jgi:hypothetical protein